ncbi:DUF2975 domain-containing protein [Nocardia sp. 2]|uniref:DUF2975 domain-containing protein n=1 Tax=Nocardia acididurans TaxID=2802282 RepID=A0ABS1M5N4_9NOCA|nr:DUF2975 domain-containing protein [Nocardia acididurans]MBL1075963.1 DUF2975 domain-containing protein [Nocardia acididurans]
MRRFTKWDTTGDYLRQLQIVVWLALAAVLIGVVTGLVRAFAEATVPADLPIDPAAYPGASLPAGTSASSTGQIGVDIGSPTAWQRVLHVLTWFPTASVLLAALAALAVVLHRARRTDPFTPRIAGGLRVIGAVLLAGMIGALVEGGAELVLDRTVDSSRTAGGFEVAVGWPLAGLGCFVVAEILARGTRMRDDLATVI